MIATVSYQAFAEADSRRITAELKVKKLEAELERATKQSTENPWCADCEQEHCLVSSDGTCAYIRDYHAVKAENKRLRKLEADFKKIWCYDAEYCQEILADKGE